MFINCLCPPAAALTDIPNYSCGLNFGQIVKLAFRRKQAAAPFATLVAAGTLANWTALLAAVDGTKMQVTPTAENIVIPGIEAITEGGDDNTTPDGLPVVVGATTVTATGDFRSIPSNILLALKDYNCEDLEAVFINQFGYLIGSSVDGAVFRGFDIYEWFIADGSSEGLNTHDKTMFRFNLKYGWKDYAVIVKPSDFNGRDLVNP